jgi:hypothetical protein
VCLDRQPASTRRVHLKYSREAVAEFARQVRAIAAARR